MDEILKCDHSNQNYCTVLPVVLIVKLYKVVPTFESVDEILECDHSNESYWAVLSCCAAYYVNHRVIFTIES